MGWIIDTIDHLEDILNHYWPISMIFVAVIGWLVGAPPNRRGATPNTNDPSIGSGDIVGGHQESSHDGGSYSDSSCGDSSSSDSSCGD